MDNYKDDFLIKEIKILNDILTPLVSSYRLSVGAAEEFNKIALAHKRDVVDAIDRADDLGHLVDAVQRKLKKYMKRYLEEIDYRLDCIDEIRERERMRQKLESRLNRYSEDKDK